MRIIMVIVLIVTTSSETHTHQWTPEEVDEATLGNLFKQSCNAQVPIDVPFISGRHHGSAYSEQ